MHKLKKISIELPSPTPKISLPRYLAEPLQLIIAGGTSGVTKESLSAAVKDPLRRVIRELIANDIRIERTRVSVFDVTGKQYKAATYYRYSGLLNEDLGNSGINLTGDK